MSDKLQFVVDFDNEDPDHESAEKSSSDRHDKLKFIGHFEMPNERYKSFSEFWPYYVSEHSQAGTRLLHLIGTTAALAFVVYFIASGRWWLSPLGLIPGYGCAWLAHFMIEKNKPATFQYPLWSFMADYKMIAFMIIGKPLLPNDKWKMSNDK